MLLRIEDTDRERSTEPAIAAILDGLKWLELDWDGDVVYQFSRAARHREVAEQLLAERQGLPLLRHRGGARPRCARRRAPRAAPASMTALWRDRDPGRRARRREADHPPEGAADRRDRDRGPGAGPRGLAEREPRRPRAAARRRQPDLHAGGGGRRPRHGRHPRHPRRRPSDQRRAPEADLRRAGLGHPEHVPHPADPRAGRRKAVEAPRRARRRGLPRHGLSAGGAAQLPGPARLEPWRPGNLLDRRK